MRSVLITLFEFVTPMRVTSFRGMRPRHTMPLRHDLLLRCPREKTFERMAAYSDVYKRQTSYYTTCFKRIKPPFGRFFASAAISGAVVTRRRRSVCTKARFYAILCHKQAEEAAVWRESMTGTDSG